MMASTTTTTDITTVPKRRRRLAAAALLAGCIAYVACSIIDASGLNRDLVVHGRRHLRTEADGGGLDGRIAQASARIHQLLALLRPSAAVAASSRPPELTSQGAGPALAGPNGRTFRFQEERQPGVFWYNALSSPRFAWHVAPYRWKGCPSEGSTFLGDTGFTFRIPDPNHPEDPARVKSKHLRFRVLRRDERSCLWNYSEACLAGGSLVMNFAKTSKDILRPGDYTLKTSDGVIRIVAYNTNTDCSGQEVDGRPHVDSGAAPVAPVAPEDDPRDGEDATPLDYLRRAKSDAVDPDACQSWIDDRATRDDLFQYNSDISVVHVDAPWMNIVLHVRQHKVATDDECVFANVNVRITDVAPGVLDDGEGEAGLDGLLDDGPPGAEHRELSHGEAEGHRVDGPFAA